MLEYFRVINKTLEATVELQSDPNTRSQTWTTVLIGQNGSRKSYLLRQILETALGKNIYTDSKKQKTETIARGWSEGTPASSIICISGTPLDRFPRTGSVTLGNTKSRRNQKFLYLGQRASNGMAGTAQSERGFLAALLENPTHLPERKHLLKSIFNHLNFRPEITIHLKLAKTVTDVFNNYDKVTYSNESLAREDIEDLAKKLITQFNENAPPDGYSEIVTQSLKRFSMEENYGIFKINPLRSATKNLPVLTFENGEINVADVHWDGWQNWNANDWTFLLKAGFLDVEKSTFRRCEHSSEATLHAATDSLVSNRLEGEDLSSGQWSWIAGLGGLCAAIKPGSLVLIDEPENSLHPVWQQQYIPMLNSIMREFPGSQAIIATHSPLIASGVDPDLGNVLSLKSSMRSEDGRTVLLAKPIESTFGWTASDVYQEAFGVPSARAPAFTTTADIALSLIRKNDHISANEAALLIKELTLNLQSLPVHDPLRNVMHSIIQELSSQEAE